MRILKLIFLVAGIGIAANLQAQSLETIGQLARDGAPNLALQLIDQIQPDAEENTPGWIFFEQQRFAIMQNWQQWQPLITRYNHFPQGLPEDFVQWARLQKIEALIKLDQAKAARQTLRELLWQAEDTNKIDLPLARRLIIRSYLIENNLQDVDLAMRHYERNYGNEETAWKKLRARVLLRSGKMQEALVFLQSVNGTAAELKKRQWLDHEALAMRLLAELRAKQRTPTSILGDVRALVEINGLADIHKVRYWAVGAEAAQGFGGMLTRVRLLEEALPFAYLTNRGDRLFALSGDDLWQAYEDYALAEGNQQQLLIGQDKSWLDEAVKWFEKHPEKARALYSIVMQQGNGQEQQQAYKGFVESLFLKDRGKAILRQLFQSERLYPNTTDIPLFVRYQLVDDAIARQDIARASELMLDLDNAPKDADQFNWGLRRARVLILGNKINQGKAVLKGLLSHPARFVP